VSNNFQSESIECYDPKHRSLTHSYALFLFADGPHAAATVANDFLVQVLKFIRSTDVLPDMGPIDVKSVYHHLYLFVTYHVIRCRPALLEALSEYYGENVARALDTGGEGLVWEGFDPSAILVYRSGGATRRGCDFTRTTYAVESDSEDLSAYF
jgi:hypothetical protein